MEDNPNTQDRFMLKKIEGKCLHWGDGEIKALLSHQFGFGGPRVFIRAWFGLRPSIKKNNLLKSNWIWAPKATRLSQDCEALTSLKNMFFYHVL